MRKFRCIKSWVRDTEGDVIELYLYQRYPREIREAHFEEIFETPKRASNKSMDTPPPKKSAPEIKSSEEDIK